MTVTGTTYDISGLVNGIPYVFGVTAVNIAGNGTTATFSPIILAGIPGVPTDVSGSFGNTTATISWEPTTNLNGGTLLGYIVSVQSQQAPITIDAATNTYTFPGLINGVSYTLSVKTYSSAGVSDPVSVNVMPGRDPGSPTGLTAAYAGSGGVLLNWVAPSDSGTGSVPVSRYRITYDSSVFNISGSTTFTATGLTNGTLYTFNVTSINVLDLLSVSTAVQWRPAIRPDAPTSVSATAGIRSASLSWTAPNDNGSAISGYTVTVSSSNGGSLGTVGAISGTSCNITGLTNGGIYTFFVTATNLVGTSDAGTSDTISLASPPNVPSSIDATAGIRSASLSWSAPNDNGSAISGYTVTVSSSNGGSLGTIGTISGTSCNITGLTNGGIYTFSVTATNGAGTSAAGTSNTISLASPPNAPSSINATAGIRSASLSWTAPDNNGSAITSYTVTVSSSNGGSLGTVGTVTGTSCNITGLTDGKTYTFFVTATNGAGTSTTGTSNTITIASVPGAPTLVTASAGIRSASLSWTAPNDNGSDITSYTVIVASPNGGLLGTVGTITGTSCTVTGLTNGGIYSFFVIATNGAGSSDAGSSNSVTLADVPSSPTNVIATAGIRSASLSWGAATPNGSNITGYTVTVSSSNGGSLGTVGTISGTTCSITGLSDGKNYTFSVTATNAAGTGAAGISNSIALASAPDAPRSVNATVGNGTSTITWEPPINTGGSPISFYTLRITGGSFTGFSNPVTSGIIISGLSRGTRYTYYVKATNSAGLESAEGSAAATTFDVPSAPGIQTPTPGIDSVQVNWSAPSNGGSAIQRYYVRVSSGGSNYTTINTGSTSLSYNVTGLSNGVSYNFAVAAENIVGIGNYSSESSSVSPAPAVPGKPGVVSSTYNSSIYTYSLSLIHI